LSPRGTRPCPGPVDAASSSAGLSSAVVTMPPSPLGDDLGLGRTERRRRRRSTRAPVRRSRLRGVGGVLEQEHAPGPASGRPWRLVSGSSRTRRCARSDPAQCVAGRAPPWPARGRKCQGRCRRKRGNAAGVDSHTAGQCENLLAARSRAAAEPLRARPPGPAPEGISGRRCPSHGYCAANVMRRRSLLAAFGVGADSQRPRLPRLLDSFGVAARRLREGRPGGGNEGFWGGGGGGTGGL